MNKKLFMVKSTVGCGYRAMEKFLSNWEFRKRARYAYYYKHKKVNNKMVLYEAFYGRGMLCNPYAIFLKLLEDDRFCDFTHVWVLDDLEKHRDLIQLYEKFNNVIFVKFESKEYLKYLCTAKYLINNSTFLSYFTKKEEQIYINTWHGIPLKAMGFDLPNGKTESANVVRNFLQADYLLAANSSMVDMYVKAYKMDNLFEGIIVEEGYPRLDLLFRFDRDELISKFNSHGVHIDREKKVILYAPTWRGESFQNIDTDVECYYIFKKELEKNIDTSKYQILIKVHQRVFELAGDKLKGNFFIPSTIDANESLALADILISDFSSIFFDYLVTGRPVLFYIPDLEEYEKNRGMYFGPEKLPGPYSKSIGEIGEFINQIENIRKKYANKYVYMQEWSDTARNHGNVSEKVIDIIFNGNRQGYRWFIPPKNKKRLLISKGKLQTNGITASLISLLNEINYNDFDVTLLISPVNRENERKLAERINQNVRVVTRLSTSNITLWEEAKQIYWERNDVVNIYSSIHKREFRRCFGVSKFDYAIDFDGFNVVLSSLCLQADHAKHIIWQHSDMMAEKEVRFEWLERVFKLYKYFDKVISCAYDVMVVNRKKLSEYCTPEKFGYMSNFIDVKRIEGGVSEDILREYQGKTRIAVYENQDNSCISARLIPYYPQTGTPFYRFITVGRISVEKNYTCLISAFAKLNKEYPNSCLYILGDGPLKKQLLQMVKQYRLTNNVFLPGNVENPFAVMKYCDCFILPSLHEGQPMVINEARVLKLPIIVSNFSSVNSVLVEDGQLVIGMSVEDIYKGMKTFIEGKVPAHYNFNADSYNLNVYKEFLKVLTD